MPFNKEGHILIKNFVS